jgi:hypothetical protein
MNSTNATPDDFVFGKMSFYRYFIENIGSLDCPWIIEFRTKLRASFENGKIEEILKSCQSNRVRDFMIFVYYGNDNKI